MKTTLDIPDALYRAVKSRSAGEGYSVRHVTIMLYGDWLATANWKPRALEAKATARKSSRHLACFGAAAKYAKKDVSHDLDEMRDCASRGRKARYAELAEKRGFV